MLISIIIPVYNRANTVGRAIESIMNQTYQDFEIIIVDDGSTDHLFPVLSKYTDSRIKVIKNNGNRGVHSAKNLGLDNINGEWFTILDSDDEMIVPNALDEFISAINNCPGVNAITCNCIDTSTGEYSGKGLDKDQWLDWKTIIEKCRGEFWGLTKTELLGGERLNEKLMGQEDTLWYKINKKSRRYYIHKALRIYHTEGDDRVSTKTPNKQSLERKFISAKEIFTEKEYIEDLRLFGGNAYRDLCFNACLTSLAYGDKVFAFKTLLKMITTKKSFTRILIIASGLLFGNHFLGIMKKFKRKYLGFTLE